MKNLIILLMSVLIVSCGTSEHTLTRSERKAQKKLRKAIKADPNIVSKQYTDTAITGYIDTNITINTPEINIETKGFDCDSINMILTKMLSESSEQMAGLYLYNDSLVKVLVKKLPSGKLAINTNVSPQVLQKTVRVPYYIRIKVPGKIVQQYVKYPIRHYWQFWLSIGVACLFAYLYFSNMHKNGQFINVNLDKTEKDGNKN